MNPTTATLPDPSEEVRAGFVRDRMPEGGLFAGHEWRIGPDPFSLGPDLAAQLRTLGRLLLKFNQALNLLYRQSVAGKWPGWIVQWFEAGKPGDLIELQRSTALKNDLPRVIRPDLILTDSGLAIAELDSVPGGIGLTAWLNETYAAAGFDVVGGSRGMLAGFDSIFGGARRAHLVVSDEASTYRPEMNWLTGRLNGGHRDYVMHDGNPFEFADGDAVYRFFELFDARNVPSSPALFEAALARRIRLTPPPKSFFEEKLVFALLWNRNLQEFWRQALGESFFTRLKGLVPYSWILDPTPLPPQGAYPGLDLTDWRQLKSLSQRDRDLILKVSGFSENAWGARGVYLGSDLPIAEWSAAVDQALAEFTASPWMLQRYEKPRRVESRWFDFKSGSAVSMSARVRLCPYYFVAGDDDAARAELGGVLATVCPEDKKILHGMRDAVLLPCVP